jgi:eukaryotic-like serine/threonine-protein kinase
MDRFELKSEAGTGGMGTVYQAIDRRTGAVVALKVLHARNATESARFDQEARLLAELSHPGIVRYFTRGTAPHGSPFIAMEWLEGETLEERLSRGTLGPVEVAHVAYRVLEALAAAHERGVVHRDIKPSNVFLVGWRLTDTRILDFGIARRVMDPKRFTRKGATVGTPLYAAPEQARGRHDVDGRADIFSLGCVLYEALVGEPPFTGNSASDVMQKVCAGAMSPLSARRPNLPPELEGLIHRMLSPDPGSRPLSASVLAAEFRTFAAKLGDLGEETALSKPPSTLRPHCISEAEDRAICAMLISLARREAADGLQRSVRDRRHGPQPASPWQSFTVSPEPVDDTPERVAALETAVRNLGGEMDRLIDRTLLVTAPAAGTAREQAMQIARAALAIREKEPDAKIAVGTGRAAFLARVPVGRLMDALPTLMKGQNPGTIRLDGTTKRLLPARFVIGESESVSLLFAEADGAGPERPRAPGVQVPPLVGRERELGMLMSLRETGLQEQTPRAAVIVGGLGSGKTRLAREFLSQLGEPPESILRCAGTLSRHEPGFPLLAPLFAAAGIVVDGRDLADVRRSFVEWLRVRADEKPPIMVIEDLQWADAGSVQLLEDVLRLLERPLLILALARPEVEEQFPGLWGDCVVETLRLSALSRKSGQTLLSQRLPELKPEVERFVLEHWEGNPLFLEELADSLAAGHTHVPEVVLAAVEARFDGLSPDVRRVLRAASLYGDKFFSAEALVAVLGEASRREMNEWLENLVMRDLVQRHADGSEVAYRIRNRLVREAAYRMLTTADRVLGRRLARGWLQGAGRTLPEYLIAPASQSDMKAATGS